MSIDEIIIAAVLVAVVAAIMVAVWRKRRAAGARPAPRAAGAPDNRSDAFFRAAFPELQPHFHPWNAVRFVRDCNGRTGVADGHRWEAPPGFDKAALARVRMVEGRERIALFDAAGAALVEFDYERQPAGAAIRVAGGKLTVVLEPQNDPRVRYWHPDHEFKWSKKDGWRFTTPVADKPIEDDGRGMRFSNDSGSSGGGSSSIGREAAAAAFVAGAGGAFAGGGASGDWDGAGIAADAPGDHAAGEAPGTGTTAY